MSKPYQIKFTAFIILAVFLVTQIAFGATNVGAGHVRPLRAVVVNSHIRTQAAGESNAAGELANALGAGEAAATEEGSVMGLLGLFEAIDIIKIINSIEEKEAKILRKLSHEEFRDIVEKWVDEDVLTSPEVKAVKLSKEKQEILKKTIMIRVLVEMEGQQRRPLSVVETERALGRKRGISRHKDFEAVFVYKPANYMLAFKLGGDAVNIIEAGDDFSLIFALDVNGHTFYESVIKSAIMRWIENRVEDMPKKLKPEEYIGEFAYDLNNYIIEILTAIGEDSRYVCGELVLIDHKQAKLYYVGAGHNSFALFNQTKKQAEDQKKAGNLLLGLVPDLKYTVYAADLIDFRLFTDGMYEKIKFHPDGDEIVLSEKELHKRFDAVAGDSQKTLEMAEGIITKDDGSFLSVHFLQPPADAPAAGVTVNAAAQTIIMQTQPAAPSVLVITDNAENISRQLSVILEMEHAEGGVNSYYIRTITKAGKEELEAITQTAGGYTKVIIHIADSALNNAVAGALRAMKISQHDFTYEPPENWKDLVKACLQSA